MRKILHDLYQERNPEKYGENLKKLFLDRPKEKYYRELKEAGKEDWEEVSKEIEKQLSGDNLIDFYLWEGSRENAFEEVLDSDSIRTLRRYIDELGDHDPESYFETYAELISSFLAKDTGRRHYRKAIDHLRELNKLDLSNRLQGLIEELKEENSNRPAFLDEISSFKVANYD